MTLNALYGSTLMVHPERQTAKLRSWEQAKTRTSNFSPVTLHFSLRSMLSSLWVGMVRRRYASISKHETPNETLTPARLHSRRGQCWPARLWI